MLATIHRQIEIQFQAFLQDAGVHRGVKAPFDAGRIDIKVKFIYIFGFAI
jgi:hypothetical protein